MPLSSQTVFQVGEFGQITVNGSGSTYSGAGDEAELAGGTFNDLIFDIAPGVNVSITGTSYDIHTFAVAFLLDHFGFEPTIFENLLLPLDWTIIGNSQSENFLPSDTTNDRVLVDFTGNNTVFLDSGDDFFFADGGEDTVNSGDDNDILVGSTGSTP